VPATLGDVVRVGTGRQVVVRPGVTASLEDRAGPAGDGGAPPDVVVEHLRKSYGDRPAVDDVSFTVGRREIFGVLGRNGAGKTTTVECLQGLRRPTSGRLRVLGLDPLADRGELRRRVGSQLQESALPDRLKVREALGLFASSTAGGRDWRALAEQWGLLGCLGSSFGALSGGQRQRLLVAVALAGEPEIVFLDEMTTGLDPAARRSAWDLVDAIREHGTTVVLVTHFLDEAERLCDRVLLLRDGRAVACGTPSELIDRAAGGVRVLFSADGVDLAWLEAVPHARTVRRLGRLVEVRGDGPVLAHTAAALVAHGVAPPDLRVERPTLEDAFLALTGGDDPGVPVGEPR
jgi:ABC-2 type transport system ATP-binding protein